jgi:hypothetical protein
MGGCVGGWCSTLAELQGYNHDGQQDGFGVRGKNGRKGMCHLVGKMSWVDEQGVT